MCHPVEPSTFAAHDNASFVRRSRAQIGANYMASNRASSWGFFVFSSLILATWGTPARLSSAFAKRRCRSSGRRDPSVVGSPGSGTSYALAELAHVRGSSGKRRRQLARPSLVTQPTESTPDLQKMARRRTCPNVVDERYDEREFLRRNFTRRELS